MKKFDICVLGLGYIGLPTASIFATKGKNVLGVDVVQSVVDTINDGRIHIEEPDLDILVKAAVQSGNLIARNLLLKGNRKRRTRIITLCIARSEFCLVRC